MRIVTKDECEEHHGKERYNDEPCEWCEIQRMREFFEIACAPEDGFGEDFELLIDQGIIVEVKPDEDFINEWGDDTRMYVFSWYAHLHGPVEPEEEKEGDGVRVLATLTNGSITWNEEHTVSSKDAAEAELQALLDQFNSVEKQRYSEHAVLRALVSFKVIS